MLTATVTAREHYLLPLLDIIPLLPVLLKLLLLLAPPL